MVGLGNPIARVSSSSVGGSSAAAMCSSTVNARKVADSGFSTLADTEDNFTERNSMFHYCKVFGYRAMIGEPVTRRRGASGTARCSSFRSFA